MSLNALNRTMLRITGINSGLDTQAIVTGLLEADQFKVDKQAKLATKLEWKGDAYREVNRMLRNFREQYMSVLNPSTNMFSKAAYKIFNVNMLTETSAVSISASSAAAIGKLRINNISQLAESAKTTSSSKLSETTTINSKLVDAFGEEAFDEEGKISFSINGSEFTFDKETSISSMLNTINASSEAGVTMSYSSLKRGFTLVSNSTGAESKIELVNLSGSAFAQNAEDSAFKIAEGVYAGQNAKLTIEGIEVERASNTFTIDGITYTLKNTSATVVDFSVERDINSTLDKITAFVDAYNTLIKDLQAKLDEPIHKSYEPLTESEREKLSETQANKWEEKAKSGLLRNDSGIRNLLTQMRGAFFASTGSSGKTASALGLTTGAYASNGQIVLDKEKLRTALSANPEEVINAFISEDKDGNAPGLITRLSNALNQYVSTATNSTLVNNSKALEEANTRLTKLEDWLAKNEEQYWRKFTAMEKALSSLNSQSAWLSSLMLGPNTRA
ncbi:MAG TPA: flagellar filament capping protein FliD [Clostridia bacterium]|nr:flagellar filament capping protein FliD [Clostridia bacterium]